MPSFISIHYIALVTQHFQIFVGTAERLGSVAAAQKSCRDWIKQTIVFIVDSFYCFVSIVSHSVVSIQLD